ncbi:HCP-like protein [Xylariomycetidae sp. FL2044]|nr:HCP-like protein [Xylariomycetidae sp. FL2044]
MATAATTPPPPTASSPSRSIHRKPVLASGSPPRRAQRDGLRDESALRMLPANSGPESPTFKNGPLSPVMVMSPPENWAQPSNASIEGGQLMHIDPAKPVINRLDRELPKSPNAPPPPPHSPSYELSQKKSGIDKALPPTSAVHLSHVAGQEKPSMLAAPETSSGQRSLDGITATEQDSKSVSEMSLVYDPNRQSRESDTTTASTQQHASTDVSVDTSASSVSGGVAEYRESQKIPQSNGSEVEGAVPESQSVPQLQYHHQSYLPRVSSVPLEANSRNSSTPDIMENGKAISRHLTPNSFNMRRSSMPRPQSSYTLYSEFGSRGRSPGSQGRAVSAQSRKSPDNRPASYVELLNVPYPQPAPAPITFDNSRLRSNIGNNASLLSAQKTLEMYRQNVKKTNDFSIQYSFAVLLISTAQEQGLNFDEPSRRKPSPAQGPSKEGVESSSIELVREAKSILTRLANGGYPFAQYYLADGYASGLFNKGKEDYNAAFPLFVLAAKHGHAESGYRAGLCYEFGWGCRKDPAKAVQYLRTAASKNHPGAMTRLGKACLSGDLGENRYREGVKWLKRATESADAMYNAAPYFLGTLYETGYGDDIFKDESYAAELFTQAAELGNPEASYRMGDAYEHGKLNCPRDPSLSVHFYTGAAERGHAGAMMGLCAWYMVGAEPVLEKDEEEAYEWARRSAELDLVKAQYAVGYFTEMGIGCRRDILEANVWYVKAADAGDERAKQRLAAIRAAVSGGGTPMEVVPPRNAKMKKKQPKDDKECVVM